eukprot:1401465-Lingulodinium_polyedra.AAC.1
MRGNVIHNKTHHTQFFPLSIHAKGNQLCAPPRGTTQMSAEVLPTCVNGVPFTLRCEAITPAALLETGTRADRRVLQ